MDPFVYLREALLGLFAGRVPTSAGQPDEKRKPRAANDHDDS
jgi:hypothetical protein